MKRAGRTALLVCGVVCTFGSGAAPPATPAPPSTPTAVEGLVAARAFTLAEGYRHRFSADRPYVTEGYVLVLDVDPALVRPRQSAEPVLYAGDLTAERLALAHGGGRLVAIVPGAVDLSRVPIWFGTPELPERVDPEIAHVERALAEAAGIRPAGAKAVAAALARGGGPVHVADLDALLREVAGMIREHMPHEKALAERWAAPREAWTERKRPPAVRPGRTAAAPPVGRP